MRKIQERLFTKEIATTFCFCIGTFWGLYVIIDYANRGSVYQAFHFTYLELALYYFCLFIEKSEILIPFALMLSAIKTLCGLSIRNEWVPLASAGLSPKKIVSPFLHFALLITLFAYLNTEFFTPKAVAAMRFLEDSHFPDKYKKEKKEDLQNIYLQDGSILLFHRFDTADKSFHDLFWIRSMDSVMHVKQLFPNTDPMQGSDINLFMRNKEGKMELQSTEEQGWVKDLILNPDTLAKDLALPEEYPLTRLAKETFFEAPQQRKQLVIATFFYKKLILPLLCLLVYLAVAPSCIAFTRIFPIFKIYAVSMCSLVAFYLVLNAAVTLASGGVFSPFYAIFLPFTALLALITYRYNKKLL